MSGSFNNLKRTYTDLVHKVNSNDPEASLLKYTDALLLEIPYDSEEINCNPNPNATVYGYLDNFPFPSSTSNSYLYDVAYWYSKNGNIETLHTAAMIGCVEVVAISTDDGLGSNKEMVG